MNRLIQLKEAPSLFLVAFALACFGPSPSVQAVSLPPDGGYPGSNTAEGQNALFSLTTGRFNTAVGFLSLRSNTAGLFNTAIGAGTLLFNTEDENTATGAGALLSNTTGFQNTASGAFSLFNNSTGVANTAYGYQALFSDTTGIANTAHGIQALFSNTTGGENTAIGGFALVNNTSGSYNIALGTFAGVNIVAAANVICIGTGGQDVTNSTWIGNVYNTTTVSGTTLPVIVSDQGQLGTTPSSRRFKKEIKPMDKASESILALKPVTFHYKSDKTNTLEFGLVAEDVADVNPDLVVRDKNGDVYTVRYEAVNAMLLNEFLKEHRKVEQQEATITQLKQDLESKIAQQQKQIESLTAGLQKVSAQLEASKPALQVADSNY